MTAERYLSFVIAATLFGLLPGPSVCFTLAHTLRHGPRRTAATILGQAAANALQLIVIVFGVGGLLTHAVDLLAWVKGLGGAYLAYLGLRLFRAREPTLALGSNRPPAGWLKSFCDGLLVCGTNPKALLYYAAFLPQFISPEADRRQQLLLLGASSLWIGILVLSFYAVIAGQARTLLIERHLWRAQARASGILMAAAGLWLALGWSH